jgi:hypothetical protein
VTVDQTTLAIAQAFDGKPGVTRSAKPGFGQGGLMTSGKLFAGCRADDLLLKLPAGRVAALIASGKAGPFSAGGGRVMREWALVKPEAADQWLALAKEAQAFVAELEAKQNG